MDTISMNASSATGDAGGYAYPRPSSNTASSVTAGDSRTSMQMTVRPQGK
jgi:hypothetical protein